MTQPVAESASSKPDRRRRLGALGRSLDARLQRLQEEYLRGQPAARADLARLRRGLGKPAGSVPELWELTASTVPAELTWARDEPSRAEQAAHVAFTLYALHQQSMPAPAHIPGVRFGQAIGHLGSGGGPSQRAITRRFMAVATAGSVDEVVTHVRGLITQLRAADHIPQARRGMDYAQLADDILTLLTPGGGARVRLRWGRDFYRSTTNEISVPTSGSKHTVE